MCHINPLVIFLNLLFEVPWAEPFYQSQHFTGLTTGIYTQWERKDEENSTYTIGYFKFVEAFFSSGDFFRIFGVSFTVFVLELAAGGRVEGDMHGGNLEQKSQVF